jgi:hypothetical protein
MRVEGTDSAGSLVERLHARRLAAAGAILFVGFAIMWGPVYIAGNYEATFLFPIVCFFALPGTWWFCITAVVAAARRDRSPRDSTDLPALAWVLPAAIVIAVMAVPVLMFGDAALVAFS